MLTHIGFRNFIAQDRMVAIVSFGSAPIQRLVREGKKAGMVIDATAGRRTKATIFMDDGRIVLSGLTPETISARGGSPE